MIGATLELLTRNNLIIYLLGSFILVKIGYITCISVRMHLNNQIQWIIIFATILMHFVAEISILYKQVQTETSTTYEKFILNDERFEKCINFDFNAFYAYLSNLLSKYIDNNVSIIILKLILQKRMCVLIILCFGGIQCFYNCFGSRVMIT